MPIPLEVRIDCGTKSWLDSVDPDQVVVNRQPDAIGAMSNPIDSHH